MKVAITTNNPKFFLSHRVDLARYLENAGHEVTVVCPKAEGYQDILDLGFQYEPVRINRKSMNPLTEVVTILSYVSAFLKVRPDVVHNFTLKSNLYGSIAARLVGVQWTVNTFTGLGHVYTTTNFVTLMARKVLRFLFGFAFANRCFSVFQNNDDREFALANGWCKEANSSVVVGSGVDTDRFRYSEEPVNEVPVILFPSRLLFNKGISELFGACERLAESGVRFELWIAGEVDHGNPAAVDEETLEEWKRRPWARFLGFQKNMPELMGRANLVCLPSYREGAPLALIEASALGRAIVTTDVPGCREVVKNGRTGRIAKAKDSESLADEIKYLLENETERHRLGLAGRKLVETEFSKDVVLAKVYQLYKTSREDEENKAA